MKPERNTGWENRRTRNSEETETDKREVHEL
jgi:hypothetical protein